MEVNLKELEKEYLEKMYECHYGDPEEDHIKADKVLMELLKELDMGSIIEAFEKIGKWYG